MARPDITAANTVALVLAGGKSSRMGGRKKQSLLLAGEPLLTRVIDRVAPQVLEVLVNTEGDSGDDAGPHRTVADVANGFRGPLTGLVSVFEALGDGPADVAAVLVVPCDGPFLPMDLGPRLMAALNEHDADVACASYGGAPQPTFSLWRLEVAGRAKEVFDAGEGGFKNLLQRLETVYVEWTPGEATEGAEGIDPFFNINTPEDLARAQTLVKTS